MDFSYYRTEVMKKAQMMKVHMNHLIEPIAKKEGLTSLQLFVLVNIGACHIHTVGALAKETEIGQANTSTLCKKMERDGFVKRERSLQDERIVTLSLTEQGEAALQRIQQRFDKMDEILCRIPEEKLRMIIQGLDEAERAFQFLLEEVQKEE